MTTNDNKTEATTSEHSTTFSRSKTPHKPKISYKKATNNRIYRFCFTRISVNI